MVNTKHIKSDKKIYSTRQTTAMNKIPPAEAPAAPQLARPAARWVGLVRRQPGWLGHHCRRCCRCCRYCGNLFICSLALVLYIIVYFPLEVFLL